MTSPLERAARALCISDGLDPDRKFKSSDWGPGTAPHEYAWHEYLPKARTVLRAIREPSDGMKRAAERAAGDMFTGMETAAFTAMIDAALEEDAPPEVVEVPRIKLGWQAD